MVKNPMDSEECTKSIDRFILDFSRMGKLMGKAPIFLPMVPTIREILWTTLLRHITATFTPKISNILEVSKTISLKVKVYKFEKIIFSKVISIMDLELMEL